VLDLFSRDQYEAFHGCEPPTEWREATARDIHASAGFERPHIVFLSAPCKGFSGLLSETASRSRKYQALNQLTLRGIWLMLEAWADDPVELIVFENVPRIVHRGRHLLDQIGALLRSYGYAVAETTHDCGELGGLGQSRKRFLLVARHIVKVPPFLYEPEKRSLRGVGEVIGRLPVPGAGERLVAVIRALDGRWHRPFTTLELAALQSLVDPEEVLELDGLSDQAWRERIGNAVSPAAAEAIASVMGRTLPRVDWRELHAVERANMGVRSRLRRQLIFVLRLPKMADSGFAIPPTSA